MKNQRRNKRLTLAGVLLLMAAGIGVNLLSIAAGDVLIVVGLVVAVLSIRWMSARQSPKAP